MKTRALFLLGAIVAIASACTFKGKDGDDGGGGQGGAGGAGGSGGSGGESSSCPIEGGCEECRSCAANGPCEAEFDACLSSSACIAIDECIALCGSSFEDCWLTCRQQNPSGVSRYDAARGCSDCSACEAVCATDVVCGG